MRRLLTFLLALCLSTLALPVWASHGPEPALVPAARPASVEGELRTPRFRILYTRSAAGAARALAERIEEARDRFAQTLGRDWPGVTEVRLGRGRQEMAALALPGGEPPGWAAALAYPSHNIILLEALSLLEPKGEATLEHELSHIALGQLGEGWPRWFQEGLAVHLSGEHRYQLAPYATLFRAVNQDRIFRLDNLTTGWPVQPSDVEIAYAQSAAFVAFLFARHPPAARGELFDRVAAGDEFPLAFAKALRTTLTLEEEIWRKELPLRYAWLPTSVEESILLALAALLCALGFLRWKALTTRRRALQKRREQEEDEAARQLGLPPAWPPPPPSEPLTDPTEDDPKPPLLH